MTTEFASNAKANAGLTTGIIGSVGTAAGLVNALGLGLGGARGISEPVVTRHEMDMAIGYTREIQAKDLQIAALESERISDKKDAELYSQFRTEMNRMQERLEHRIDHLEGAVNAQAVWNAGMQATVGCIKNQIDQMSSLFALKIPNTSVCPGWGEVTTSIVTGAAAGA